MNQKVKEIFKLRGNRDREKLAHWPLLIMPVEEFSHAQYSALPSVEWQQRGENMDPPLQQKKKLSWALTKSIGVVFLDGNKYHSTRRFDH